VVDDDHRVLESLESLFLSAGYSVLGFGSAQAFFAHGTLDRVDIVISDIGMTPIDGIALRRRVQEQRPDVPVLLVTGHAELFERARRLDVPSSMLFSKPFDSDALMAAVGRELGR
jgi:FixJ family two-component response regulator